MKNNYIYIKITKNKKKYLVTCIKMFLRSPDEMRNLLG